jgi:hypothetical protein
MISLGNDDGEHTGGVNCLGEQERRERGQQGDHVLVQRMGEAAAYPDREPRRHRAGQRAAAAVGEQEQPGHAQRAQVPLANGDANGDAVDDQRGTAVDQTLRRAAA